jgi:hypothetical protein
LIIGDGIRPVFFNLPAAYTVTISGQQSAGNCH